MPKTEGFIRDSSFIKITKKVNDGTNWKGNTNENLPFKRITGNNWRIGNNGIFTIDSRLLIYLLN
jgi:hypothetical protein